jgi:DNA-binding response OmpR family regulator/HPt (histidine-containing phosphotransfer) domain-containing protein
MKILVIEDDLAVADALKSTLASSNYAVEIVHDGEAGLAFIEAFNYDLLLLDVILPNLDGISICRHVRSSGYTMPILLLTSRDSNHDRAVGLDAGADDYVVKPFDPEELSARIRALLRRGNDISQPTLTWEHLSLDPRNCEVTYDRQLLTLTPKEYSLLELFLRNNRRVFSCGAILEHLWTYEDTPSEEAVRTHIKGLRQKLKVAGAAADLLETVYGIGYRLKPLTEPLGSGVAAPQATGRSSTTGGTNTLTPTAAPPGAKPNPHQMLADIWYRHRDQTIERIGNIERAIAELQAQALTEETRLLAWNSAHSLAGALGTFGLMLGSQAAKKIELSLEHHLDLTPAEMLQLQAMVAQLWSEIDRKVEETMLDPSGSTPATTAPPASGHRSADAFTKLLVVVTDPDLAASLRRAATDKFELEIVTELNHSQLAQPPQAIILDLDCFPDINDGLTALAQLERDCPMIPVLVVSQPTSSIERRIEVARRGGRMFLAKPVSATHILLTVDRVLQQVRATQAKVLIVDDDRSLLEGLAAILSPQGMIVTTLAEPSQFWDTLEACVPDLLILDLDMPLHNGIELCQAVRTDPRWATLPIMFLTAHTAALAVDRVFAAGADDFASKPIYASALITRIINRLERSGIQRWIDPTPPSVEQLAVCLDPHNSAETSESMRRCSSIRVHNLVSSHS